MRARWGVLLVAVVLVTSCTPRVVAGHPVAAPTLTPPLPNPNVVVTATDGLSELTMPRSWTNHAGDPDFKNAVIAVRSRSGKDGIAVYTVANPDESFTEFRSFVTDNEIRAKPGTKLLEKPLKTTLGDLPAVRYRLARKDRPGEETLYIVEGKSGFHLVKSVMRSGYGLIDTVLDTWREVTDPV